MATQENQSYKERIQSIDMLRGVVIIIMALDHVRHFFGAFPYDAQDLSQDPASLFLTRWITNLCAPTFVLLSGISAYLYGTKVSKSALSTFLLKRGVFLIFIEVTFVSLSWKFDSFGWLLQVIWAMGLSMIVLSGLIWLPKRLILVLSLICIVGHNYFDNIVIDPTNLTGIIWNFLHVQFKFTIGNIPVILVYPLIPWPAIMGFGYCIGYWMKSPMNIRCKNFVLLGATCLTLFLLLRIYNHYGDPYHWSTQSRGSFFTFLSFIKVSKYPASLLYVLQTIGIVTLLWPVWEKWNGFGSRFVLCFGKVAMFFYLVHIMFIHILASIYSRVVLHAPGGWWMEKVYPEGYHFNITLVYVVWVAVILSLYPLCLWYKKFKENHRYAWLRYI